jgi:glutamate-1-semialdehyde 2,1-aminomutase
MLVTGKAIANGAPLSLLIVKEHLREATIKAQVGGTHSKEVMSIYCALTTLEIMNESNGYATLRTIGERTSTIFNEIVHECGLNELIKMSPILGGALVDITLADRLYNNPQTLKLLQTFFLDNSILLLVGHPSFISLAHSGMDWNEWRSQIFKSLAKWKKVL